MSSRRTPPQRGKSAKKDSSGAILGASAALAVLAVAALLYFTTRDGGDETAAAAPEGMAHVHGLAVDPADGQLLAGTHFGAFRVGEGGEIEQFGPTQDFMGFSVAGPGKYLASGHPGAGQGGPGNLGLIESADGGKTWETVSLKGEADFHTLKARHGRVYGHSGGVLMVSEDKKTWEERGQIAIADLAISPEGADTIVVTTQQGLGISDDGGRTFRALPDTPVLVLVTWTDEGRLVGIDPTGAVHASEDNGTTWAQLGNAGGEPAALTAAGDDVFVATRDGRIVESADGGATFTTRYQQG